MVFEPLSSGFFYCMVNAIHFERSKMGDFIGRVDTWVDVWGDILEVTKTKCLRWGDIWGDKIKVINIVFIYAYYINNLRFMLFSVYSVG